MRHTYQVLERLYNPSILSPHCMEAQTEEPTATVWRCTQEVPLLFGDGTASTAYLDDTMEVVRQPRRTRVSPWGIASSDRCSRVTKARCNAALWMHTEPRRVSPCRCSVIPRAFACSCVTRLRLPHVVKRTKG